MRFAPPLITLLFVTWALPLQAMLLCEKVLESRETVTVSQTLEQIGGILTELKASKFVTATLKRHGDSDAVTKIYQGLDDYLQELGDRVARLPSAETSIEAALATAFLETLRTIRGNFVWLSEDRFEHSEEYHRSTAVSLLKSLVTELGILESELKYRQNPSIPKAANATMAETLGFIDRNGITNLHLILGTGTVNASVLAQDDAAVDKTMTVSFDALNSGFDYSYDPTRIRTESGEEKAESANGSFWKYFSYATANANKASLRNQALSEQLTKPRTTEQRFSHINLVGNPATNALFDTYRFSNERNYSQVSRQSAENDAKQAMINSKQFRLADGGRANLQTALSNFATVKSNNYFLDVMLFAEAPSIENVTIDLFEAEHKELARNLLRLLHAAKGANVLSKLTVNLYAEPQTVRGDIIYDTSHGVSALLGTPQLLEQLQQDYPLVVFRIGELSPSGNLQAGTMVTEYSAERARQLVEKRLQRVAANRGNVAEYAAFIESWYRQKLIVDTMISKFDSFYQFPAIVDFSEERLGSKSYQLILKIGALENLTTMDSFEAALDEDPEFRALNLSVDEKYMLLKYNSHCNVVIAALKWKLNREKSKLLKAVEAYSTAPAFR